MITSTLYRDMAERTDGQIYIGVVGPVRTGKSTFIKKFMETLVLPNITDPFDKERARDEMPQSAAGKTVMTAEPKFVPDEAVELTLGENARLKVRMVDCVGYLVPDALGSVENGGPRMVHTPWQAEPMPFTEAAEFGTRKVITDHATIGIVVTTDGTIGEIPRENYLDAETRVIRELQELNRPFAVIVNSADPSREESVRIAAGIEETYHVPVALVNCLELNTEDIRHILEMILLEFPVREIAVEVPGWLTALGDGHPLTAAVCDAVLGEAGNVTKIGDVAAAFAPLSDREEIESARLIESDLGTGRARIALRMPETLYYRTLGELTGFDIPDESALIDLLRELSAEKRSYDKLAEAVAEVDEKGYGIVTPDVGELTLAEPELVRQNGAFGVRLKAGGPSIHMIRADIETEISPIVGTEQQSEELLRSLLATYREDPAALWDTNLFGKSLHEMVRDSLHAKLGHISDEARAKLGETLQRVINEGSGGLICIIL